MISQISIGFSRSISSEIFFSKKAVTCYRVVCWMNPKPNLLSPFTRNPWIELATSLIWFKWKKDAFSFSFGKSSRDQNETTTHPCRLVEALALVSNNWNIGENSLIKSELIPPKNCIPFDCLCHWQCQSNQQGSVPTSIHCEKVIRMLEKKLLIGVSADCEKGRNNKLEFRS